MSLTSALTLAWASHFKVLKFFMLWARHCQASYPVRGQDLLFLSLFSKRGQLLKKGICFLRSNFFAFKSRHQLEGWCPPGKQTGSKTKCVPF